MNFMDQLQKEANMTRTENDAKALISTNSGLLDLFGTIGAMREKANEDVETAFIRALAEDKLMATKIMFHTRNIRGGLGERKVFRTMLHYMGKSYPEIVKKNFDNIAFYGRWDDFFALIDTPCEKDMFDYLFNQLMYDYKQMEKGENVSLLAKWLKTQKASSKESREIWAKTIKAFGMTKKQYQQTTAKLRRYIDVTEVKMCDRAWDEINYYQVPSGCMLKNKNAFQRNDGQRFNEFIEEVQTGDAKINSSTLFPFDIFRDIDVRTTWEYCKAGNWNKIAEEQWKALPDYLGGKEFNAIVMADTSGSMMGNPINVALSLAVYFAERNKGAYHNKFMTFSRKPNFVELKGVNLEEKVAHIPSIVENTDIEAAFDLILDTALNNKVAAEDMPKSLIIISDMQFDGCQSYSSKSTDTLHDTMKQRYNDNGYELPNIVYWNVDDKRASFQVNSKHRGVQLVSGMSAAVFKQLMDNVGLTPYDSMINVLNDEMYDRVVI